MKDKELFCPILNHLCIKKECAMAVWITRHVDDNVWHEWYCGLINSKQVADRSEANVIDADFAFQIRKRSI